MSLTICLSPDEVEALFAKAGIPGRFSPRDRDLLSTAPVVELAAKVFGFPIPSANAALTLSNLKRIFGTDPQRQPSFFDHPWYQDEPFTRVSAAPGWHFIAMEVLPGSVDQPLDYINSLEGFELAAAVDIILMLFFNYMKTGEQLLSRKHTWCGDQASLNRQVTVGAFGRNGVFVSGHPKNYTSRGLGICPKVRGTFLVGLPADLDANQGAL